MNYINQGLGDGKTTKAVKEVVMVDCIKRLVDIQESHIDTPLSPPAVVAAQH